MVMYAVCVEYYGKFGAIVPCGNNGLQKLRNKTRRGWMSETEIMRKNTCGDSICCFGFYTRNVWNVAAKISWLCPE